MRLASYNVENLFDRAKAMNLDTWEEGRPILEKFAALESLLGQVTYSDADKRKITELIIALGLEKSHPHIHFILAGEGPHKMRLEQLAAGHCNIHFLGLQPNDSFNQLMATADFHLIPQKAEAADLVLPSKLGAIFASARPVIAMAEEGTGLAAEVTGAGLVIPPGDSSALELAICQLSEAPGLREHYGEEGRRRALDRWDRRAIVHRWSEAMAGQGSATGQKNVDSKNAAGDIGLPVEDAVRSP